MVSDHNAGDTIGKKRKRKRSKKSKNDEFPSDNEHQVDHLNQEVENIQAKQNKKIKFNDDDEEDVEKSKLEQIPNESKPVIEETSRTRTRQPNERKLGSDSRVIKYVESNDSDSVSDSDSNSNFKFKQSTIKLAEIAEGLLKIRQTLPIYQHKDQIVKFISENQVTIVIGETGSGKSTQIPQFLMSKNSKAIAVTQPRRVAAASLAARVSEEYGCKLGTDVGYQVRFTKMLSHKTKLKYLTDGMLLREIMMDKELKKYGTIILDEAHERTILTDLIMGFIKSLLISGKRKDLKVVVMSATLNAELFSKFFDEAQILYIEGKTFPVSRFYLKNEDNEDIVDCMIRSIVKINLTEPEGDILCFLPGQEEIDNCVKTLEQLAPQMPREAPLIVPLPLYAALSPYQQSKIFEKQPKGRRKVILATNIAETSITVSGVKYVIDSGLRKVKIWKHNLGLSTLLTTPISQASARQRAGRAGRESAGKVFRLYQENEYVNLPRQQESEIKRNDIILPVLTLKKLGVDDLLNWTWLEDPGQESIISALNNLYTLGALNEAGIITGLGYKMSVLPLPPQLSVVLIAAAENECLAPVIEIVSCLSVDNLILNVTGEDRDEINAKRRTFTPKGNTYGDLIALYELYQTYKSLGKEWCLEMMISYKGFKNVQKIKEQLKEYMLATVKQDDTLSNDEKEKQLSKFRAQLNDDEVEDQILNVPAILKSFLKGFITNTAVGMPDRSFRTFNSGQLISIHPSSVLFGKPNLEAIMYIEYVFTTKGYARNCSAIELSWIQEVAPHVLGGNKISING
ncbi:prh1 [Candida pseudojiufengensis]|uniref:prh1 n=1 Tax=Candida pseudojiufengensis TaxID=497109 RepID=UPI0022249190|nr:prh1 [Candida pseudojiufengensis]KAI5962975.1 prh1 [Candida pseudojiufengensis]